MPIEIGRGVTPEEESRMLAHITILRDVLARALEILESESQPDDASPTESSGSTGEAT